MVSTQFGSDRSISVLRAVSELEKIRPAWESWQGNPESDIDFYMNILGSSRQTLRPHVIVISRAGRPDAILVGRLDRKPTDFWLGYLNLTVKADVLFFVGGPLRGNASPENCRLFVEEIQRSLSRGDADAAFFHHLPTDSELYSLIRKAPAFFARDHVRDTRPHFSRSIPPTVEELHRSLSPHFRRGLKANKLAKDFPNAFTIRSFTQLDDLDTVMRDAEEVARRSYQRGIGVGFADTPQERERLEFKARKRRLRSYVLYVADRPVAFFMGTVTGKTFGGDYMAYDPDFGKYSPGIYLIVKVMEDLCSRVERVDFGAGAADYKKALSDHEWTEAKTYIFAPTAKGLTLALARFLMEGSDRALKQALEATGLLRFAKRVWRGRLSSKAAQGTDAAQHTSERAST